MSVQEIEAWEVMIYFYYLSKEHSEGRISLKELKKALPHLVFKDAKGDVWTLGVKTGGWFRYHEGGWAKGFPKGKLRHIPPPSPHVENHQNKKFETPKDPLGRELLDSN